MCLVSGNPDFRAVSEPPQKKGPGLGARWAEEGPGNQAAAGERVPRGAAVGKGSQEQPRVHLEEEDRGAVAQGQFPGGPGHTEQWRWSHRPEDDFSRIVCF